MIAAFVMFLLMIALGLLALFRTEQFNTAHIAFIRRFPWPPRKMPGLRSTRLVGAFFVTLGAFLLGAHTLELVRN